MCMLILVQVLTDLYQYVCAQYLVLTDQVLVFQPHPTTEVVGCGHTLVGPDGPTKVWLYIYWS